ncbi:PX domain-containing protein kinase-like protein isoform X2 [Sitophilus oryzae]|uniref:PX domain-containing protein kinase-like protein n=1 Tax=Sitophilus oryzae TaxID=7048 RepID=A0A6J2Y8H4_SITOR|nr:PX domain-containing protein kinase-like protein isoform X2 [Sitophilus oryzae]
MAIFERQVSRKVLLDDTEPITCQIENWRTVDGHTEFVIKVHRGPFSDHTWKINKRYNDFLKLHQSLQVSGIPLDLPPKKLIGNMDPQFISERQKGLQTYLNSVLMNPILVSSLPARSFVDPANYCQPFGELALQHVSLALRGEVGWEVVGPLAEIGWRIRKHFYTLKCKSMPKEELIGSWTDYGPDKYLDDKDMHSVFKSLHQIQHPFIEKISLCLCTDIGGLVVRNFNKNGSLRDLLCGSKPKLSFLKKYGNPKGHKQLSPDEIALYGRQILEALKFLHEKGFPYGHLQSGNILIENDRIKLLDIENGVLGVPSYYRPYFMQHKRISTSEAIDVYCFGHVLYEMAIGSPLHESVMLDDVPECPPQIKKILESILSHDACKNGLPNIETLLSDSFFAKVQLNLTSNDKAHFKIPTAAKEHLKTVVTKIEERLKGEQKVVRSQKLLTKVQEMMSSEEERKKHRSRMQEKLLKQQKSKDGTGKKPNGVERCDSVNSSAATSIGTSTPPSVTGSTVPSPPPPPPLVCPDPVVPPVPPPLISNGTEPHAAVPQAKDRSALLSAITSFNKSALKKTQNNDGAVDI